MSATLTPMRESPPRTADGSFTGTWAMTRLILRRDRWLLPLWIVGFAVYVGGSAAATVDLYPDEASRVVAADAINSSAAVVALYGRVVDPTSLGSLSTIKAAAFGSALVAIVMVVTAVRHTRSAEDAGFAELVGAGRVGRAAPVAATLLVTAAASAALGLASTVLLVAVGLPVAGSLAFGLAWAGLGAAAGALGCATAQVASSAGGARAVGLLALGAAYVLRAVGDVADAQGGPWHRLVWLSPIGWAQQVQAWAGERWAVLALFAAAAVVLGTVAVLVARRRDLGSGMIDVGSRPPRMAPTSTSRLALHLHARSLVTWALSFALVGAVLGSLAGSLDDMLSSDAMREFFEKLGGGTVLIDTFIGSEFAILAALAAAYAISAVSRMRSEEVSGHLELLLAAGPDRQRWAAGHLVVALGGGTALLLLAAAPMAATMAAALGGGQHTLDVLAVALASLPAVWLLGAVAVVLVGWLPRVAAGAWVVLVAAVALGEFGEMWHAPAWLRALSPLTHDPTLPVSGSWVLPLIVMTALSLAGVALGLVGLRRRDIPA